MKFWGAQHDQNRELQVAHEQTEGFSVMCAHSVSKVVMLVDGAKTHLRHEVFGDGSRCVMSHEAARSMCCSGPGRHATALTGQCQCLARACGLWASIGIERALCARAL